MSSGRGTPSCSSTSRESSPSWPRQRAEGRYLDALSILSKIVPKDHATEALCREHLGNYIRASQSHELAGDFQGALKNPRSVPDVVGALRLAELLNHEDLPALQWLGRYCEVMGSLDPHVAAKLTDAERRLVAGVRDDVLLDRQPLSAVAPPDAQGKSAP